MGRLVDALNLHLAESIRTETPVGDIEPVRGGLRVNLVTGQQVNASSCVLAVPAWAAAPMVRTWPSAAAALEQITFVSVVMVTLTYNAADLAHLPADASGFLIPHVESPLITACSFASNKWPQLGEDQVHVRVSLGHAGEDAIVKGVDADLLPIVRSDLAMTAGIEAEPLATRVSRWPKSFPQYEPGHVDLVAAIDEELSPSGIFAAGASLAGIGIPACINQGRTAARESIRYVTGLDSSL